MQLRQQVQETSPLGEAANLQEEAVTARPLSPDMGDVQVMQKKEGKPWFFLTVDTQAFYNSNVLYAASVGQTFAAWQIITTPEIGFAPQIQDEQYSMFFPKAGFRYQFYTYAQAGPYPPSFTTLTDSNGVERPYTIANQNFRVSNPYASIGWAFSDDLYLEFSVQGNIYTSNSPYSPPNNFLDEYPLAWQSTWFKNFAEIQSVSATLRASYVIANPNQFSRTDNNLTFAWVTNPTREINTQIYASFRLAKYTGSGSDQVAGSAWGSKNTPLYFTESDRLDLQQTYGASVTWSPIEYLSLRAYFSWTQSSTSIPEPTTGQFEAYNAGTGLNLIYRF